MEYQLCDAVTELEDLDFVVENASARTMVAGNADLGVTAACSVSEMAR